MSTKRVPLNVCYIIGSLRVGGAEKQCINVLNTLKANNKHIILLSDSHDDLSNSLNKDIIVHRIPVRLRFLPYYILLIMSYLIKEKINIVHTHMYWSSVYGVISARLAGVPVIITSEHGLNPWKNKIHYWIERWLLTPLTTIRVCVSNDIMLNRIKEDDIPRHKLIVIPNGTYVMPLSIKLLKPKIIKLIAVGRLVPAKDYITLIEAMEILSADVDNFELSILGDGPLKSSLLNFISNKLINKHIKIIGNVDNVNEWLEQSTFFVMSSITEGQPMSLLEAMAIGLPIVATKVGGIPETVEDGKEALLVNCKDPHLLAEAILLLINNIDFAQKLGKNASMRVISDYSIESVCERLESLYLYNIENR